MTLTNNGLRVDPSNAEQARAWDGEEGAYWAAHAGHRPTARWGWTCRLR